MVIMLVKPVG